MRKKERQVVVISNTDITINQFNFNIFLNFQPDEVIIRQYTYSNGAANTGAPFKIISSLVDNRPLFTLSDLDLTVKLDTIFPLYQPIQGNFSFNYINLLTNQSHDFPAQLSFTLEFIKYL